MNQNRNQRAKSYFFNMRKYHNTIKRGLYNKYTKNIDNLLDLACGKGGDLDKWVTNKIKNVVGYDIDAVSIKEAERRVRDYNSKVTKVSVYVKDLSEYVIPGSKKMDVISSMFAFHYFFKSKDTFETIMASIENNLKEDGIFMGAMFDGLKMRELIKNNNFELVDDKQLRFKVKLISESDSFFGNKISVFLKDTVLDEPMDEYLVYFSEFVKIMKKRNFELIESKMFSELYSNENLNNIEKSISFLNRTFVFKRNKSINSVCKTENNYLIDCEWKKSTVLEKYKDSLTYNINNTTSILLKKKYEFLRDNFEYIDITQLPSDLRDYFKPIYTMYLLDVSKYE